MSFNEIKKQDQEYIMHTYNRVGTALVKGRNATAWDSEGKEYIDFTSGIGVNSLGYSDPMWVKAVSEQAAEIQHISNYYYHPKNTELAELLAKASGMSRMFFGNSGAEANECAIKVAHKYGETAGAYKIITLEKSFHGRTLTTLAATGQDVFHKDFLPLTEGFLYAKPNDIDSVKALVDNKVCAVMIEVVQGEGGVNVLEKAFVQELKTLCEENGMLLIVDEVQTGIGRTGAFFGYQGWGIMPDVVTSAKGVAGGLPMGICMVSEALRDLLQPGMQGSTFGGNPVVSAGAVEVVKRVTAPGFLESVQEKAKIFKSRLLSMPGVKAVVGKGLMIGIELDGVALPEIMNKCFENGLLILSAGSRVRFLPPLTITDQEIEKGLDVFEKILKSI